MSESPESASAAATESASQSATESATESGPESAMESAPAPGPVTGAAVELEVAELPETPLHPTVDPALARVEMFGTGELPWQRISPALRTTRTLTLLAWLVPMLVAAVVGAFALSSWLWIPAAVLAVLIPWGLWLIGRQVSAISYLELEEDLVIRKGRLFRQVSSIPYGRLQYVDLESGPLERKYGMATLEIFTASPASSASIPGLLIATAEEMRERLMQRGEAQRAGL